jgi:hypothetical protein
MARRLACLTLILLVCITVLSPAFETIDRWDCFPQSGSDIVLSLVCLVASVGVILVFALLSVKLIDRYATRRSLFPANSETPLLAFLPGTCGTLHSPPLSLRI